MSIHLDSKRLINMQQMEVAINGPDGATHLILCTGIADLGFAQHETYTFLIGPPLAPRQFVGVNALGALSGIHFHETPSSGEQVERGNESNLILVHAGFDKEARQVRVNIEVRTSTRGKLAITYQVYILAERSTY
jgi:hypothetical protein